MAEGLGEYLAFPMRGIVGKEYLAKGVVHALEGLVEIAILWEVLSVAVVLAAGKADAVASTVKDNMFVEKELPTEVALVLLEQLYPLCLLTVCERRVFVVVVIAED